MSDNSIVELVNISSDSPHENLPEMDISSPIYSSTRLFSPTPYDQDIDRRIQLSRNAEYSLESITEEDYGSGFEADQSRNESIFEVSYEVFYVGSVKIEKEMNQAQQNTTNRLENVLQSNQLVAPNNTPISEEEVIIIDSSSSVSSYGIYSTTDSSTDELAPPAAVRDRSGDHQMAMVFPQNRGVSGTEPNTAPEASYGCQCNSERER